MNEQEHDLELLALAEGGHSLSPERKAALESAIAQSPELAARYEATRAVVAFVDGLPTLEPSASFSAGLHRRLDEIDAARGHRWWTKLSEWASSLDVRWSLVTASTVAAGAAVMIGIGSEPEPVGSGLVAQVELLEVARNLELLEDFDVIENLDVLEDLELIETLDGGDPG